MKGQQTAVSDNRNRKGAFGRPFPILDAAQQSYVGLEFGRYNLLQPLSSSRCVTSVKIEAPLSAFSFTQVWGNLNNKIKQRIERWAGSSAEGGEAGKFAPSTAK